MNTLILSSFFFVAFFFFISAEGIISYSNKLLIVSEADVMKSYTQLDLPGVIGPESLAFDCNGNGPYVGVSDGRILKWHQSNQSWLDFAVSSPNRDKKECDGSTDPNKEPECGRALGLKFNPATCDLYIADAYYGLLVVGPMGGVPTQLAASAEGVPFRFANGLDIDPKTGAVYFTDSSIFFQRREYLRAILSSDRSGRLLKYDPNSKKVTVLFKGLAFPNGVALSNDNRYIYSTQGRSSSKGKIQKYKEEMINEGWVFNDTVGIKFSEDGKVVKMLDGNGGEILDSVSEVAEYDGGLWFGSSVQPYVGYTKI
ncbi:protein STRICTOSIDINE SYNTHASE-LIKE 10 [Jatropha curcas]|uniref:protein STRICTOSIDINE SYNTHASE-LIKE 10 n=1 Tax=Jatropha curcas TaxID=180498 RepID=UPI00189531E9|nr:protein STRICTOSIDINE SYNTHASE-LIKE 10 [Jatropha curcas]